jgi:uncharacterized protein (DUF1501 family)
MNRRELFKRGLALGGGAALLSAGPTWAQTAPADYKALVCVFLFGGNDSDSMIVPNDDARFQQQMNVRAALMKKRAEYLPLSGVGYALHPNLVELMPIWEQGALTTVFNVGPLDAPLTKAEVLAKSRALPQGLFSHSTQQDLWSTSTTNQAASADRSGWGARLSDAMQSDRVMVVGDSARFAEGGARASLTLPETPGVFFGAASEYSADPPRAARNAALRSLLALADGNTIAQGFAGLQKNALESSSALAAILARTPQTPNSPDAALSAPFNNLTFKNDSDLSRQLYQVAKLINNRATVGGTRHVYFVSLGGFDTHAGQLGRHDNLMRTLSFALKGFYGAMEAIGMRDRVTTFTMSDFGRSLKANSTSGTDHGWGGHQLVLGGAVAGGLVYGRYPDLTLGGVDDFGSGATAQGRWLPTISVDQYGATLAKWFGLADSVMPSVFPNINNFSQANSLRDLGFMRT